MTKVMKFYTDSCGSCTMYEGEWNNIVSQLSEKAEFESINAEYVSSEVLVKYAIKVVPTLVIERDGEVIKKVAGGMSLNQIKEVINETEFASN